MKNIYLVGFMGTGKTSVGKILAEKLNREFVEMDSVIEAEQAKPITEIFAQDGEGAFRQSEKELLKKLTNKPDLVVSCGGGLVCDLENLKLLKASGVVIALEAAPATIYQRTKTNTKRPLLNVKEPLRAIEELLAKRRPFYQQADQVINTEEFEPEQIADQIAKLIKTHES